MHEATHCRTSNVSVLTYPTDNILFIFPMAKIARNVNVFFSSQANKSGPLWGCRSDKMFCLF